ncbi:MAG: ABC transporter permease [Bifidobacteriaceae bacterium]|jgi:putative ABC transport system permease protein|nr:ABC transporter permease [Bifidobacteriaceae bacterium]
MFRFTLLQLRASLRHLAGGAVAIVVATAFIAATMAGAAVMDGTMVNILREPYTQADLVVARGDFPDYMSLPHVGADEVKATAAVAEAFSPIELGAEAILGDRNEWVALRTISPGLALGRYPSEEGTEPTRAGEASIAKGLARRLGASPGDQINLAVTVVTDSSADVIGVDQPDAHTAFPDKTGQPSPAASAELGTQADQTAQESPGDSGEDPPESVSRTTALTVTGIFDDSLPSFASRPQIQTPTATIEQLGVLDGVPSGFSTKSLLITLADGAQDTPAVRQEIADATTAAWSTTEWVDVCAGSHSIALTPSEVPHDGDSACSVLVMSPDQAATMRLSRFTGGDAIKAVALVFGLVSLMTGTMVIANTFQVMIAGRARTLALLRAVGATRGQIRRSVILEAFFTGLVASGLGVLAGWGLIRLALAISTNLYPSIPMPTSVGMPPMAVVMAVAAGATATVLASLVPSRLATGVAPIEALRPQEAPSLTAPAGRTRMWWSIVMATGGVAITALGLFVATSGVLDRYVGDQGLVIGAGLGVVGGGLLAAGIILGTVFWLPKVVARIAGWIAKRPGGAQIAASNVVRNPRRTAASATALMIAVTLVSSMLVAAASLSRALEKSVEARAPVDLQLGHAKQGYWPAAAGAPDSPPLSGEAVEQAVIERIEEVDGVTGTAPISAAEIVIDDDFGVPYIYAVNGAEPDQLRQTLADPTLANRLKPNVVLVDSHLNDQLTQMSLADDASEDGEEWTEPSPKPVSGSVRLVTDAAGETHKITFVYAPELDYGWAGSMLAEQTTLETLGSTRTVAALFRVARNADPVAVRDRVLDLVIESSPADAYLYDVQGAAVEKAEARKTINIMLLIGVALLTVSVLVALAGVGNTLSLSVIERRHENALLRALGLSRGQTRWMMAVEALVISGVAGLMGIAFGTMYGFIASALLVYESVGLVLVFPGAGLAVVMGLTLASGLLASILPGRRAARTAPAEALAAAE